jgi:hypothetical protein
MLVHQHECMSRMEFSLEYFVHANKILGEYFLTRKTTFVNVEEYFVTCSWINDFNG